MVGTLCLPEGAHGGLRPPTPFRDQAMFTNSTGRFIVMESSSTFGRVRPGAKGVLPVSGRLGVPVSECRWGTFTSVAFLGPPPKMCRRGERIDGDVVDGYARIRVRRKDNTLATVIYPFDANGQKQQTTVGPFSECMEAGRGVFKCAPEEFTAIETFRNKSAVWLPHPIIRSQGILLQLFGVGLVVVFAVVAAQKDFSARWDLEGKGKLLRAAAADATVAGVSTLVLLLAHGRSVIGLDTEFGQDVANGLEAGLMAWSIATGTIAWMIAAAELWGGADQQDRVRQLPWKPVFRELVEVPILVSITIIWPMAAGPHFLMQLQFLCGSAVSFISGRASGILRLGERWGWPHNALAAAGFSIGGILCSTILTCPTIAHSGAVTRGLPALALTATLQMQFAAVGAFVAAPRRLRHLLTQGDIKQGPATRVNI